MRSGPARAWRAPRLRLDAETVLLGVLLAYIGVLTVWPLGRLFVEALAPGADGAPLGVLREELSGRTAGRALANTLTVSLLATGVSVLIGASAAFLLTLTDVRMKGALAFALLLPLLIPPQITALAWIELMGPSSPILSGLGLAPAPGSTNPMYSPGGIVLVMGIEHATLVFLTVRAALAGLPRDLVEAAQAAGARPLRIVARIIAPLAWPSVMAGAALAFVSSIGNFGIPALLGIPARFPMMTTLIYRRLNGFGPSVLGEVAALALVLALLAGLGLALRAFMAARARATIEGSGAPIQPFALGRVRPMVETAAWLVLLVISLLPLAGLIAGSLTPAVGVPLGLETATLKHYRFTLIEQDATHRAFANSVFLAGITAVVCALAAVTLAYLAVLRRRPLARVLDLVADAPYAIPGTVLGIAIILVFLRPLPLLGVSIYGTLWILLAAYLARFLALALRPTVSALELMDPGLDEAGQVAGAGAVTRLVRIVLPVVAPAAVAGALLVFMTAINELTVSALLWSTGTETLGVMIFLLHYEGNSPAASALATVAVALTLGLAMLASLLGRRLPRGAIPWQS